jgi:hypothetical protein
MKTAWLIGLLGVSLAGNAILFFRWTRPLAGAGALNPPSTQLSVPGSTSPAATAVKSDLLTAQDGARLARLWSAMQTGDLKALIEHLRAAGFPPSLIRALVAAQVSEQFAARRKALLAQREERPYWKSGQTYLTDAKTTSALRDLGREQSNLLKQLLGSENVPGNEEALLYQRRQFGDLPSEKAEQVQNILSDYGDMRNQIYVAANGVILAEDRDKIALLEKEQRSDLAAVLTPDELENYQMRSSPTANSLRSQLALFNPTEDEYRALFKIQEAFDDQYGSPNVMTASSYRERQAHQQELLDQVKNVLTPDRMADYKQAIDPQYQMVNRLVARLDLPATAATEVVSVQQDVLQRAGTIRSDANLAGDLKNAQLNALADEATGKLTSVLGARGLDAYKQYGGQWIQNLVPRSSLQK